MNRVDVCFIVAVGVGLFLLCATVMTCVSSGHKKNCGCSREKKSQETKRVLKL